MSERDAGSARLFGRKATEGLIGPDIDRRSLVLVLAATVGAVLVLPRRQAAVDVTLPLVFLAGITFLELIRSIRRGDSPKVALISVGGVVFGPLVFIAIIIGIGTLVPPANDSPIAIVLAGLGAMILGVGTWLLIWRQLTT